MQTEEQQQEAVNCTYWSTGVNSAADNVVMVPPSVLSMCSCSVPRVCFVSTRQISRRADWRPAVWGRCWTCLWKRLQIWFSPFWLRCNCRINCFVCVWVLQELFVCAKGRAGETLCHWLKQWADRKSSVIDMSCVFTVTSTEQKLWFQWLGQEEVMRSLECLKTVWRSLK